MDSRSRIHPDANVNGICLDHRTICPKKTYSFPFSDCYRHNCCEHRLWFHSVLLRRLDWQYKIDLLRNNGDRSFIYRGVLCFDGVVFRAHWGSKNWRNVPFLFVVHQQLQVGRRWKGRENFLVVKFGMDGSPSSPEQWRVFRCLRRKVILQSFPSNLTWSSHITWPWYFLS